MSSGDFSPEQGKAELNGSQDATPLLEPRDGVFHRMTGGRAPRATTGPRPVAAKTLGLMKRIDELDLMHPFYGSRQMMRALHGLGYEVESRRVGGFYWV